MKPHTILYWTVGIVAGLFTLAALGTANLWGVTPAVPALYVIPYQWKAWRFERTVRREMKAWLHG